VEFDGFNSKCLLGGGRSRNSPYTEAIRVLGSDTESLESIASADLGLNGGGGDGGLPLLQSQARPLFGGDQKKERLCLFGQLGRYLITGPRYLGLLRWVLREIGLTCIKGGRKDIMDLKQILKW